ncbi:terminal uridylyltransferase 4-like [Notothenia coriiceps]|uniref:polynucleotide adenylyltransferase n=1 Tax=Notothenia coriiceps TaxID=8208 RepID=A0A6I9N329_9TELE|nr:PREDICTED: terminal uridylyltransferase 4-like [Notothenia coriiceps]
MDESKSPVKTKLSQPRGPKASSAEKSNKEAPAQREAPKSTTRSKENLTATKDEHNIGSQGSRGPGKTFTDIPQDKRRGRPPRTTRLTGRTSSGERGKGKAPGSQQKLVAHAPDSNVSLSADNSPLANRETSFPVGHATRKKDFTEQARSSSATPAKEKSYGGKAAALMHQPVEEVRPTVEEGPLTEQQLGLRQAEERLYRDYIHRLLKQSIEYPNYQYLCKLCSVHIENIQGAHKHIKEKRHKKNIMEKQEENELRSLPPPSAAQMRALDAAVLETATQYGISEEDFEVRKALVIKMEEIIKKHLSACALRLYGSCLTRFAFKTSDINIDVTHPSLMTQPEVLIQVLEILKKSSEFSEVESDFHAKVPAVFCRDVSSGLMCKVSAGNDVAWLTTNHMAVLSRLEPRLIPLVMAFRYWARLCHVDCQSEGGLPSYSFALMVIFFLQQRKQPILPVYLGRWIEGFDVKRVDEYHLTGISLDSFVRWERRPPSSTDNRNDNRGEGRPKPEQKKIDDSHFSEGLTRLTLDMGKDVTLGQLWLDLLRFYTLEFALEEHIISIRLKELLSREGKNWPRRRLGIEDPFALKRNVARSLNSQMVFEYLQERFRTAYKYFACPQRRGCGGRQRGKKGGRHGAKLEEVDKNQEDEKVERGFKEDEEPDSDDADGSYPSRKKDEKTLDTRLTDMVLNEGCKPSLCPNGLLDSDNEGEEEEEEEEEISVSDKEGPFLPEDLHYVFDKMIFTGGKPPTVVCSFFTELWYGRRLGAIL